MAICDECANYVYDEECECWVCIINMDEDEVYRFLQSGNKECPYYDPDDEYFLARKQ